MQAEIASEINILASISMLAIAFAFGSFTNVLIYRIPLGKSIIKPASTCPSCNAEIKFFDNIPIISYLILGAKCRNCSSPISPSYPIVELIVALASLPFIYQLVYVNFQSTNLIQLFFIEIFISLAVALAAIDNKNHELPHELTYSGILIALVYAFLFTDITKAIISLGLILFVFDFFTHISNKIFFKKDAAEISPAALTFRNSFLHEQINFVYFAWLGLFSYLLLSNKHEILDYLLLGIGVLYIINDVFVDFFFMPSQERESAYQITEKEEMTVMGGGDAAMAAFIACIFADIWTTTITIWIAFPIALLVYLCQKLFKSINSSSQSKSKLEKFERIAFGSSLASSLIIAMILKIAFGISINPF